jgi:hypothetical protein
MEIAEINSQSNKISDDTQQKSDLDFVLTQHDFDGFYVDTCLAFTDWGWGMHSISRLVFTLDICNTSQRILSCHGMASPSLLTGDDSYVCGFLSIHGFVLFIHVLGSKSVLWIDVCGYSKYDHGRGEYIYGSYCSADSNERV